MKHHASLLAAAILAFAFSLSPAGAQNTFSDSTELGFGWRWTDWFGDHYDASSPWIYSTSNGWDYVFAEGAGYYIYSNLNSTWSYTEPRFYPIRLPLTAFTGFPQIRITTDGSAPIVSKDETIEGDVWVDGSGNIPSFPSAPMEIRGRGNSTWNAPKKPYQMKLESKGEFLGLPSDKKWILLADYLDPSKLRNRLAFEMGYVSNLEWTPKSTFSELYVNGEYSGLYHVTQKVEESSNRVDIGDTGYLLEVDEFDRLDPDDVFCGTTKFPVINIKEPKLEAGSAEFSYIDNYLNDFENVLFSEQFNDPLTGYAAYIDVDSFVDWYLISEISKNTDSQFLTSIYMNIIPGEKLKMGPLWDFDLAFGNINYNDTQFPEGFWIKANPWYERLFQDPVFEERVRTRFAYFRDQRDVFIQKIRGLGNQIRPAVIEEQQVHPTLGIYTWPSPVTFATYDEYLESMIQWFTARIDWLDQAWGFPSAN